MLAFLTGKFLKSSDKDNTKLSNYDLGEKLGEGAFAVVRRCTRKSDGAEFAIKLIDKGSSSAEEAAHELKILGTLGLHRHIVSLIDHFELSDSSAVVMEIADGGEVFESICEKGAYSEADAARVVRQVALALAFMHSLGIVHRDLKPENLLLTRDGDVKVADFGLAEFCGKDHPPLTGVCGTFLFMAPEVIRSGESETPYGCEADLFSLGLILFCLFGAYSAFDPHCDKSDEEIQEVIVANKWSFEDYPEQWTAVSKEAKDLIKALLEPEASKRMTADGMLQAKWTNGEGTSTTPLKGSHEKLAKYNAGRKVWVAAVQAASIFAQSPQLAAHLSASSAAKGGKRGASSKSEAKAKAKEHVASLPQSVTTELKESFALFDIDGNGEIDEAEMLQVVRSLGAKDSEAAKSRADADIDGDGSISFDEFAMLVAPIYEDSTTALRRAFDMFDADGSGDIDRKELGLMLRKLGFGWQGTDVFSAADTDGDGKVSWDEFLALFNKGSAAAAGNRGKAATAAPPAKRRRKH
jgi:calcium-dependent protein kinase